MTTDEFEGTVSCAIAKSAGIGDPHEWGDRNKQISEKCLLQARAAIGAMEPAVLMHTAAPEAELDCIERIAAAIARVHGHRVIQPYHREAFEKDARAALAAVSEDPAMLEFACTVGLVSNQNMRIANRDEDLRSDIRAEQIAEYGSADEASVDRIATQYESDPAMREASSRAIGLKSPKSPSL